jgi:hypothetical protein
MSADKGINHAAMNMPVNLAHSLLAVQNFEPFFKGKIKSNGMYEGGSV